MLEVKFYSEAEDRLLKFAVIYAVAGEKMVLVKHRERRTYEIPGGHREPGETIEETAARELKEETGAETFTLKPVSVYSVTGRNRVNDTGERLTECCSMLRSLPSGKSKARLSGSAFSTACRRL